MNDVVTKKPPSFLRLSARFIGALLLFPGPADSPLSPSALGAYEAAMERLQARGQELSHEHELERRPQRDGNGDTEGQRSHADQARPRGAESLPIRR